MGVEELFDLGRGSDIPRALCLGNGHDIYVVLFDQRAKSGGFNCVGTKAVYVDQAKPYVCFAFCI